MITTVILTAAAFLGGALNALAGGGSLVTFPALLFAGLNPIDANASSVVALFPATFSTVWGLSPQHRKDHRNRCEVLSRREPDRRLAGRPASAVDADRHLRGAGAVAGSVRDGRVRGRQFRAAL